MHLLGKRCQQLLGARWTKGNQFVSACELYFQAKQLSFNEDKTTFAGFYLTGAACRWFDTYHTGHPVLLDWDRFVSELKKRHGETDPRGAAIRKISALKMHDLDHVSDFLVKFAECQALINWEDGPGLALSVQFYNMLPQRLKQMFTLSIHRYLKLDLFELQDAALEFNCDHWDYEAEKRAPEPWVER